MFDIKDDVVKMMVVIVICLTILSLFSMGINHHTKRIKIFVENGYTRATIQGSSETTWVKTN